MIYNTRDNEYFIKTLSAVVHTQLPAHIREDYPRFVDFMSAYFAWLEEDDNATHFLKNLYTYQDVDSSVDIFIKHLKKEFLANVPENVLCNEATLLKNIKQFYQAKGTEKSYEFLFRFLFNSSCDFYYPRTDIFRASDGKWIAPIVIRLVSLSGNVHDFVGKKIIGTSSNTTAIVDEVNIISDSAFLIYELRLNASSITQNFTENEIIEAEDESVSGTIKNVLSGIKIINAGSNFQVNDIITTNSASGFGARARVTSVSDSGAITGIKIMSFGVAYDDEPTFVYPSDNGQTGAVLEGTISTIATYDGFFLNEDGELSTTKYLHDGFYYQQFSYVLFVTESINNYREIVKKLLHPAGLALFGAFRVQTLLDISLTLADYSSVLKQVSNSYADDEIIRGVDSLLQLEKSRQDYTYALTYNYRDLERNKFNYKQFDKYDANTEMAGVNDSYWGDTSTPASTTFITNTTDDEITLSRNVSSSNEIVVYNHATRSELTAGVGYSLTNSTTITLSPFISATENNAIYVYYLNYQIGNTQIAHIENLVLADFEDTPYADINIAPDPMLKNSI